MKYLTTTLLFLVSILIWNSVPAQFQICNSSTSKALHDVNFIDADIGIAVGDSGTIIRSTDGGLNWVTIMSNDTVDFVKVNFFDNSNGIAVGSDIYRTSDAGLSWTASASPNGNHYDLEILDSTTCLVSGYPVGLIKSTDRGTTFTVLVNQNPNEVYGLLSFIDENVGYTCGYGGGSSIHTLKTTDGGNTWSTLVDSSQVANPTVMEAMSFVSENTGFKGGWYNGHLQKSVDGGNHWSFVNIADSIQYIQILDFHIEADQPGAYYASGWYGEIVKSTDGGDNWFELNSDLSTTTSLYGIYFIDEQTGWAVGAYGTIIKTTTGGVILGTEETTFEPVKGVNISPNPTTGRVTLDIPEEFRVRSLRLLDLNGSLVQSFPIDQSQIDLTGMARGIYLLEIVSNHGKVVEKIILE